MLASGRKWGGFTVEYIRNYPEIWLDLSGKISFLI
jgi:hypothetical protein